MTHSFRVKLPIRILWLYFTMYVCMNVQVQRVLLYVRSQGKKKSPFLSQFSPFPFLSLCCSPPFPTSTLASRLFSSLPTSWFLPIAPFAARPSYPISSIHPFPLLLPTPHHPFSSSLIWSAPHAALLLPFTSYKFAGRCYTLWRAQPEIASPAVVPASGMVAIPCNLGISSN